METSDGARVREVERQQSLPTYIFHRLLLISIYLGLVLLVMAFNRFSDFIAT